MSKIVKMLVRSCFLITVIKCLKGHRSLGSLFNVKKQKVSQSLSQWVSDKVTYWAVRWQLKRWVKDEWHRDAEQAPRRWPSRSVPSLFRCLTFKWEPADTLASDSPDFNLTWWNMSPSVLESGDWYLQPHVHRSEESANLGQSGVYAHIHCIHRCICQVCLHIYKCICQVSGICIYQTPRIPDSSSCSVNKK